MRSTCSKPSVSLGAAIGIAVATVLLTALLVFTDDGEGASNAAPFIVIMLGSAAAVGTSGGGCCCVTKLLSRKEKRAEHPAEVRVQPDAEGENPFAHRRDDR